MGQKVPGPPRRSSLPSKISKELSPRKIYYFKIIQLIFNFRWDSYPDKGGGTYYTYDQPLSL